MNKQVLHCSFCGKSADEVQRLVAGPEVSICNECHVLMVEIFADVPASPPKPPEPPPTMGEGTLIREPERIAAYVAIAKELGQRVEIEDPPIAVKTATGAKVLAWVLIED